MGALPWHHLPPPIQVVVGEHDHSVGDGEQRISPASWTSHPSYNKNTQDNDFAIIQLATSVTFSDAVSPVGPDTGLIEAISPQCAGVPAELLRGLLWQHGHSDGVGDTLQWRQTAKHTTGISVFC